MDDYESLKHTKGECKYHVVFIPKCRRKRLYCEGRSKQEDVAILERTQGPWSVLIDGPDKMPSPGPIRISTNRVVGTTTDSRLGTRVATKTAPDAGRPSSR